MTTLQLYTKSQQHYRPETVTGQDCGSCIFRVLNGDDPSTCKLVQGTVDPEHVCDLFEKFDLDMANGNSRSNTAAQANAIDRACALTPSQRRTLHAVSELRATTPEPPVLGRKVKRFIPGKDRVPEGRGFYAPTNPTGGTRPKARTETRSIASKVASLVQKHSPRLASALELESVPATTKVIQDIYTDSYGDVQADVATDAPRLASLLAGANTWAANILDAISTADPGSVAADPMAQASSVVSDASVAADNASTLDTADTNGSQVRWVLDSGDACPVCQDNADGGPYDPSSDDLPDCPAHKGCQCTYEEVKA